MLSKLTERIMRSRATRSLNVIRVHAGCDGTHFIVGVVPITQETRRDCHSSGLPNECRLCVTFVMFHSVHKHVIVMMVTKMIWGWALYSKDKLQKGNLHVSLMISHLIYEFKRIMKLFLNWNSIILKFQIQ